MQEQLPQHKAYMLSDFGIRLKKMISSQDENAPMTYAHQDDYYVMGLVERGSGHGLIDFKEVCVSRGDMFVIQPGQVHRFISSNDIEGWLLFVDSGFIGHAEKRIFNGFLLSTTSPLFKIDNKQHNELRQVIAMIASRIDTGNDDLTRTTIIRLTETFTGIVVEAIRETGALQKKHGGRQMEIALSFLHLLAEHITINRSPSYYASLLNISPGYLNEIVKEVTGMSVTLYIRNELILQAKRLLVHTGLSIKEISNMLGIDDYAYFSRIFMQTTGISPSAFRLKNHG